jgi:hypothetical protein
MKNRITAVIALVLLANLGWLFRKPASLTVYGTAAVRDVKRVPKLAPNLLYTYHHVVAGESPYGISRRYGMSLSELWALNGLTKNSVIHPGDQLMVYYYRSMLPTDSRAEMTAGKKVRVLTLVISDYDNEKLIVARGPSPQAPDFTFLFGHGPPGGLGPRIYLEGYIPFLQLVQLLEREVMATAEDEVLVVHIAGHGEIIDGKWYLLPSDFYEHNYDNLLSGRGLLTILNKAKGSVLLILDSCHSGAIGRDARDLTLKPDFAVIASSLPEEKALVVDNGQGRNYGLFTLTWSGASQEKARLNAKFNFLDLLLGAQYRIENASRNYQDKDTGKTWQQNPIIAISPRGPFPYWH